MSFPICFSYHFYPVGQGLFSSGAILRFGKNNPRFLWVYDCGSSSSNDLIDEAINRLEGFVGDRKRIDLLTLSHFDHDHISGVVRLLNDFKVGTLLLPYMPLAQRLILAFEEGGGNPGDSLTDFFLNPVGYLAAQEGPGIERILFILPSGGEGPAYPAEGERPQELGPDGEINIDYRRVEPTDSEDAEFLRQRYVQGRNGPPIEFVEPQTGITLARGLWEFIPYNDDPEEPIPVAFLSQVAKERANLLKTSSGNARDDALRRLKEVYDLHFGAGSEERNVISLFLYSGPIYRSWDICCLAAWKWRSNLRAWPWRGWPHPWHFAWDHLDFFEPQTRTRSSILYTGDGYLDTSTRLKKLIDYLDARRVQRIGVIQVMHHGAEANWHAGVAPAIAPLFSVFSSDPERKKWKHPHAPVLRDFWSYGAVQVDKENDFTAYGFLGSKGTTP